MKVIWSKRAQRAFYEQVVWYEANRGHSFVITFKENISTAINTLSSMPSIGTMIKMEGERTYRKFVNHKRCTLYYWYDEKEFHIVALKFSSQL